MIGNLVTDLQGRTDFQTGDHDLLLKEGRGDIRHRNMKNVHGFLEGAMLTTPYLAACHLRRVTNTVVWLMGPPATVNGMEMGYQEWHNTLFLLYGVLYPRASSKL